VELNKRVLIGTVGYHLLQNHSVGPILLPQLKKMDWPAQVTVEEMNWGPIAIVQYFQTLEIPFDRIVFLVAIERPDRKIGNIDLFQWRGGLPSETQIQACIGDAATGVISIDNLLIIGEFFKIWPKEVYLIDVEPGPETAGEHLTEEVNRQFSQILRDIHRIAYNGDALEEEINILKGDTLFNEVNHGEQRH
jgi:hypothetical protein